MTLTNPATTQPVLKLQVAVPVAQWTQPTSPFLVHYHGALLGLNAGVSVQEPGHCLETGHSSIA